MTRLVDDLLLYARNETPTLERQPRRRRRPGARGGRGVPGVGRGPPAPHRVRGAARACWSPGIATRCARRWPTCWPTPPAWPRRARRSRSGPGARRPWVWLAVDDQGPGHRPRRPGQVFQRFWRGQSGRPGGERRSGLGSHHRAPDRRGPRRRGQAGVGARGRARRSPSGSRPEVPPTRPGRRRRRAPSGDAGLSDGARSGARASGEPPARRVRGLASLYAGSVWSSTDHRPPATRRKPHVTTPWDATTWSRAPRRSATPPTRPADAPTAEIPPAPPAWVPAPAPERRRPAPRLPPPRRPAAAGLGQPPRRPAPSSPLRPTARRVAGASSRRSVGASGPARSAGYAPSWRPGRFPPRRRPPRPSPPARARPQGPGLGHRRRHRGRRRPADRGLPRPRRRSIGSDASTTAAISGTNTSTTNTGPTTPIVPSSGDEPVVAVAKALTPAVVQIQTTEGLGSGVIYDSHGPHRHQRPRGGHGQDRPGEPVRRHQAPGHRRRAATPPATSPW